MGPFWNVLIPILIGGGSATTATGDPAMMGGGLLGVLLGWGVAYMRARYKF